MLSSGNAMEAVKKILGIISSTTRSLILNSKSVVVFIDGLPSTLTGNGLQNYLSSLPANAIDKVELIYNPAASFQASGSVINIVTSTKRMKGINASANINYNFNKYQKPGPLILMNGKKNRFLGKTS